MSFQEDALQNPVPVSGTSDKTESLVRVLRELTSVQRNLANLQVELQGRQVSKEERIICNTFDGME